MTQQDEDTRAVVDRYRTAWVEGDLAALTACYHDDFMLHWIGDNPLAGTHRGKLAALKALAAAGQRVTRTLLAVEATLVGGDQAALVVRERFERDGRIAELPRVLRYRVADDRLAECWVYDADQKSVDAFLS